MPIIRNDERDPLKLKLGNKIRWMQENDKRGLARMLKNMSDAEAYEVLHDDEIMLREKQWLRLDWPESIILFMAGRASGKAIDSNTPILTTKGMVRLGDIQVGDSVFDETGQPTKVLAVYDSVPDVCYRLHFSDGVYIDACADHLWETFTQADRRAKGPRNPAVRTTQQIVDTHSKHNHSIPMTKPVMLTDQELMIDPYIIGYWIGDGCKKRGVFSCHTNDQANLIMQLHRGNIEAKAHDANDCSIGTKGLVTIMREHYPDMLNNKNIPEAYLMGSVEQRLAMLRGLMDSDGTCSSVNARVEFCSKREDHARAVLWLARSLGYKPTLKTGSATLNGVYYGEKYRVRWYAVPEMNPFLLQRKADLVVASKQSNLRNSHRRIVKWEPVPSVPMRCLTVDSPKSLFLIGDALIPTHNTHAAAATVKRAIERHGVKSILYVAPTARTLNKTVAPAIINRYPDNHPNKPVLKQGYIRWPNGAEVLLIPAEAGADAVRGANTELLILEEAAFYGINEEIIIQAMLTCRLPPAKTIVVTTPKATPQIIEWMQRIENKDPSIRLITGSTYDNRQNLSKEFIETVYAKYKGTRLEKTELEGVLILENDDALFKMSDLFDAQTKVPDELVKCCIGVDPALISKQGGANRAKNSRKPDSTGIVVSGKDADGTVYTIEDVSGQYSPDKWARIVASLYDKYADSTRVEIIVEVNVIGLEMIQSNFRNIGREDLVAKITPQFSSISKMARALPYVLMFEQGRLKFNIDAKLDPLFKELSTYTGVGKSPDRMDAAVFSWMGVAPMKANTLKIMEFNL
jgi:phage terminase large subunit-like protein